MDKSFFIKVNEAARGYGQNAIRQILRRAENNEIKFVIKKPKSVSVYAEHTADDQDAVTLIRHMCTFPDPDEERCQPKLSYLHYLVVRPMDCIQLLAESEVRTSTFVEGYELKQNGDVEHRYAYHEKISLSVNGDDKMFIASTYRTRRTKDLVRPGRRTNVSNQIEEVVEINFTVEDLYVERGFFESKKNEIFNDIHNDFGLDEIDYEDFGVTRNEHFDLMAPELLLILYKAIKKFWSNTDNLSVNSYPKSQDVINFIEEECEYFRGVLSKEAEKLIRPYYAQSKNSTEFYQTKTDSYVSHGFQVAVEGWKRFWKECDPVEPDAFASSDDIIRWFKNEKKMTMTGARKAAKIIKPPKFKKRRRGKNDET